MQAKHYLQLKWEGEKFCLKRRTLKVAKTKTKTSFFKKRQFIG